jgi:hypothetical protein
VKRNRVNYFLPTLNHSNKNEISRQVNITSFSFSTSETFRFFVYDTDYIKTYFDFDRDIPFRDYYDCICFQDTYVYVHLLRAAYEKGVLAWSGRVEAGLTIQMKTSNAQTDRYRKWIL